MSDFASGVTIKINGTAATITAADQQADHAVINYTITPAVQAGDTVTWEYSAASGHIVAESGGAKLGDVSAQSVTNNVSGGVTLPQVESATLLNGWRVENLSTIDGYSDSDPVGLVTAQYGSHDYTQSGDARPVYKAGGGSPYVDYDGLNDCMAGGGFADSLTSFAIFFKFRSNPSGTSPGGGNTLISKLGAGGISSGAGWVLYGNGTNFLIQEDGGSAYVQVNTNIRPNTELGEVVCAEKISNSELHLYFWGINRDGDPMVGANNDTLNDSGPVTNFSTTDPVRIATDGEPISDGYAWMWQQGVLIYQITDLVNWPTDRASIGAWLAATL